jgi:hypothetical protein
MLGAAAAAWPRGRPHTAPAMAGKHAQAAAGDPRRGPAPAAAQSLRMRADSRGGSMAPAGGPSPSSPSAGVLGPSTRYRSYCTWHGRVRVRVCQGLSHGGGGGAATGCCWRTARCAGSGGGEGGPAACPPPPRVSAGPGAAPAGRVGRQLQPRCAARCRSRGGGGEAGGLKAGGRNARPMRNAVPSHGRDPPTARRGAGRAGPLTTRRRAPPPYHFPADRSRCRTCLAAISASARARQLPGCPVCSCAHDASLLGGAGASSCHARGSTTPRLPRPPVASGGPRVRNLMLGWHPGSPASSVLIRSCQLFDSLPQARPRHSTLIYATAHAVTSTQPHASVPLLAAPTSGLS